MQVVSTREFRANQKKYFDLAESECVLVSRRNARPVMISVAEDDELLSKTEIIALKKGIEDVKAGRTYRLEQGESLSDLLKRTANV